MVDPGVDDRRKGAQGPPPVRLIKRYANRKLYDTGIGQLTSLQRIEQLIRAGIDIRVVDHATHKDVTADLLVTIVGSSVGDRTRDDEVTALLSLIRSPNKLLASVAEDDGVAEQLRVMRERIRLLSATLDAVLENAAEPATASLPPANGTSPGTDG